MHHDWDFLAWLPENHLLGSKEPNIVIGADCHPSFQTIAFLTEREPNHSRGKVFVSIHFLKTEIPFS
jgi:hypothetical protein